MAEQNNNQQDLNQLLQVRYDKLHELQTGIDRRPYDV